MALAHVTFIRYYDYEIEIDDELYDEDPEAAEKQAIEDAYDLYRKYKYIPIADTSYDEVEVEFE